ncbi:SDR family NAD(P)-dependent oxidoreductase [Enteractinococcus coprophilus]|uniref:3-oxoacyl-[acyl-carrier protein] reductase n=1 Tax=Enteractinococcus coprophilus TaxID=1027633 RepID=A0A543AP46_9MICC|nr:SDR family NAD(P)-dependent oxidoreductase [Enteractinococcus coprophilus]TQL74338.1 3-oxoacyl-[acyl-carrier protein] reductase [Enteractinococcus coprophilus]
MSDVAVITGAGGGIGRATVRRFLAAGWDVAMIDIGASLEGALEEAKELAGPGQTVRGYFADAASAADVEQVRDEILEEFGGVKALLLVAGTVQTAASVGELDPQEWERVLSINLTGPFLFTRAFARALQDTEGASVVAVSSQWGRSGHPFLSSYSASKAGLIVAMQSFAQELAPKVRVNTVCPGHINTAMHTDALQAEAELRGIPFEEMRDIEWGKVPALRAGEPDEIAGAIFYLASDDASYITGASLDVNGGSVLH